MAHRPISIIIRSSIHLLMLFFASCSTAGPEERDSGKENNPSAEAEARKAAKTKKVNDDCAKRFSAQVAGASWEATNCHIIVLTPNVGAGPFMQIDAVKDADDEKADRIHSMRLVLPVMLGDDTTFQCVALPEIGVAGTTQAQVVSHPHLQVTEFIDGAFIAYFSEELSCRVHRKHEGGKYRLSATFSTTVKDRSGKRPAMAITEGTFINGWLNEPKKPFMDPATRTADDGKGHDFGYAVEHCGKIPGTETHLVMVSNVLVYDDDGKENLPLRQRVADSFEAALAKYPVRPVRTLPRIGLPAIIPIIGGVTFSSVANSRHEQIENMREKPTRNGGRNEVIEVTVVQAP